VVVYCVLLSVYCVLYTMYCVLCTKYGEQLDKELIVGFIRSVPWIQHLRVVGWGGWAGVRTQSDESLAGE